METDVIRYTLQGVEMTFRIVQGTASGGVQLAAFLKAALSQYQTEAGKRSLNAMLRTGETLNIGQIPFDKTSEFKSTAKEYGLVYHQVKNGKINLADIMFKTGDLPKFNTILDR